METEVEVNVSAEEIAEAITQQDHERIGVVLQGINGCAQWLKAIPDEMIAGMNESHRKIVGDFLREQSARFMPNVEVSNRPSK